MGGHRHLDYAPRVRVLPGQRAGGGRYIVLLSCAALAALALGAGTAGGAGPAATKAPPHPFVGAGELEEMSVPVRSAPSGGARIVARLPQFRPDYRPTTVLALASRKGASGKATWYKISVPGRPNGRTGWIPAGVTSLRPVKWQVVIYRGARQMELWKDGRRVFRTTVAVGAPGMETPLGLYYVTVRFRPVQQTFLGVFAFETSAYSKLSDWPGGGKVGIHGTYAPHLLGQAVSHGCVRMSNAAAAFLRDRIPVGTPIRIVA
jgi:lipoprotein-anchoring transpeptidase ErfK/SrfK